MAILAEQAPELQSQLEGEACWGTGVGLEATG